MLTGVSVVVVYADTIVCVVVDYTDIVSAKLLTCCQCSRGHSHRLLGHKFFASILAKTKKMFAKPFLSVHMGPRSNLLSKKMVNNLVTLSL